MVLEIVVVLPVRLQPAEEQHAVGGPPQDLQHVRHRMRRPDVLWLEVHRLPAGSLGQPVVAALLVGEGTAGEHGTIAGRGRGPMR